MATTVEPTTHTGEMSVLDRTGDVRTIWDRNQPAEVEAARTTFNRLVNENRYAAFRAEGERGEKGARIREFSPDLERIILVPPIQGG